MAVCCSNVYDEKRETMLYIMRHGRTDWNELRKMQGRTDIPLNETGREMARKAHDEYMDVHFDVCFASPLIRAKETAEIVLAGRDVPILIDERLAEMGFGEYEGLACSFDIPDCPINVFFKDPANYKPVGGAESMEELFARTGEFIEEKVRPLVDAGKDVLIVGHGAMNSSIICRMNGWPIERFWDAGLENCKLMRVPC